MNIQSEQKGTTKAIRSVREVMDAVLTKELMDEGMSETQARQELAESRQMADRYEELLAKGYTEKQIDALWEGKGPQEILAG